MLINHLDDNMIQEYLDGNATAMIRNHLEQCSACRENLRDYQNLYKRLQDDSPHEFKSDFAEKVLSAISTENEKAYSGLLTYFLSLLGSAASLFTIFYFYGIHFLESTFDNIVVMMDKLAKGLDGGLTLIIAAAMILALLGILDRNIARFRRRIL
jgi:predicted anti-sigma-YlaC factor YlaD